MTIKEKKFIGELLRLGLRLNTVDTGEKIADIIKEAEDAYKEFIKNYKEELCK